jgi:hypothetical protein
MYRMHNLNWVYLFVDTINVSIFFETDVQKLQIFTARISDPCHGYKHLSS